jgi:hypothetical protein
MVAPAAPAVNHLLFADDSLLFLKASLEGARETKEVLEKYCNASGQHIYLDKSSILFSKGCPTSLRKVIKEEIEVQTLACRLMWAGRRELLSSICGIESGRRCWDG